jgi:3-oxoacyl-[acyl-carrier-protein] synthase III
MQYQNVCLESFACSVPEEIVTSEQIESWLAPVYRRLRLPEGRLELMTGIVQRRFWPRGTLPSRTSAQTAEKAIRAAGMDRLQVGALIHGSVCRDYLEPATACRVHRQLGLRPDCLIYDVSNACLGLLDGIVQVANMIELGQIRAGIVVGTESSRALVESTVRMLNEDESLARADVKRAMASLTLGSASAAVLLVDRRISRTGNRLLGGLAWAGTQSCELCHGGRDVTLGGDARPVMWTDSEALLQGGIQAAKEAFPRFLDTVGWDADGIDRAFCHQVGRMHRKLMFEALGLSPDLDYSTLEWLGNTGSVALPLTAALGVQHGHVQSGDQLALMGIASGINALILGVDWQESRVEESSEAAPAPGCVADHVR